MLTWNLTWGAKGRRGRNGSTEREGWIESGIKRYKLKKGRASCNAEVNIDFAVTETN